MSLIKRSLPEDIDITDPTVRWEYERGEPVMKDITVPKQYEHMLRRDRTPEYDEAVIRDYIKAHPGEVITGAKFVEILDGLTTAPTIIRKLMKRGNIKRHHHYDGTRGAKYHYTWEDSPRPVPDIKVEPVHIPLIDPVEKKDEQVDDGIDDTLRDVEWNDVDVDEDTLMADLANAQFRSMVNDFYLEYSDSLVSPAELSGANTFRKYMLDKLELEEMKGAVEDE